MTDLFVPEGRLLPRARRSQLPIRARSTTRPSTTCGRRTSPRWRWASLATRSTCLLELAATKRPSRSRSCWPSARPCRRKSAQAEALCAPRARFLYETIRRNVAVADGGRGGAGRAHGAESPGGVDGGRQRHRGRRPGLHAGGTTSIYAAARAGALLPRRARGPPARRRLA